jgi:hypothetical protein
LKSRAIGRFAQKNLRGHDEGEAKISRNKFGGAAIIAGRRPASLRRWRRKRKGGENEDDAEKRARLRGKTRSVVRSRRSRTSSRIFSSRFCIFHLREYVRSAAPHFRQETFYRWHFLTAAREVVALYASKSRKLAGEHSFFPEECVPSRSRGTIASYECS